jgi:hypothetical protein
VGTAADRVSGGPSSGAIELASLSIPGLRDFSTTCATRETRSRLPAARAYLGPRMGAGDENRTRTISLGSAAVTAASGADLPVQVPARDRDCPLVTLANGPLMARRSCSGLPTHVRSRAQRQPGSSMASRPGPQGVQRPRTGSGAAGIAISGESAAWASPEWDHASLRLACSAGGRL